MRHLRTISIAAAFGMVFTLAPLTGQEQQAQATNSDPCATAHQPLTAPALITGGVFKDSYEIASAKDLVYLSMNFKENVGGGVSGKWLEKHFVQTAPIDLGGCLFTPIGAGGMLEEFSGSYNGQFEPISGLVVNASGSGGFFGRAVDATIKKTVLVGVSVIGTNSSGSLVGSAFNTDVEESSATGFVTGTGDRVGGLLGLAQSGSSVSGSFADVSVTGQAGSGHGGLVGALSNASVTNSYALGNVSGNDQVGGLVGNISTQGTISQSFAANTVDGNTNVGGLVGGKSTSTTLTVNNSFWDKDSTNQESTLDGKGTGESTANMTTLATYNTVAQWPIVNGWEAYDPANGKVWGIRSDLNDGYPFLLWEYSLDRPLCPTPNEAGVYEIAHEFHLIAVGTGGADGSCGLADNYVQVADIDLDPVDNWTPIGNRVNPFTGEFDGGNHTIANLTITAPGNDRGLFGFVGNNGTVKNINLESVSIDLNSRSTEVGGLAGQNNGTIRHSRSEGNVKPRPGDNVGGLVGINRGTISHSHVAGVVETPNGGNGIGGLVGYNRGVISESSSSVTVTGQGIGISNSVGGFAGINDQGGEISKSFASGNVAGNTNIGGFAGVNRLSTSKILNSYSLGDVSGVNSVGTFFGLNQDGKITSSYSTGDATEGGNPRGFGVTSPPATVTASFWQTPTPDTTVVSSGEAKTELEMKTPRTFADAGWSISCQSGTPATVWGIAPTINEGYPFLVALNDSSFDGCATPSQQNTTSSQSSSGNETVEAEAEDTLTQTPFSGLRQPATTTPDTDTTTPVLPESDTSGQDSSESPTADGLGNSDTTQEATTPAPATSGVDTRWLWGIGLGGLGAAALIAGGVAWARGRV